MSFRIHRVKHEIAAWWKVDVFRFLYDLAHLHDNDIDLTIHVRSPRQDILHAWTNIWVEGMRAFAYFVGHIIAIAIPAWLLLAAWVALT